MKTLEELIELKEDEKRQAAANLMSAKEKFKPYRDLLVSITPSMLRTPLVVYDTGVEYGADVFGAPSCALGVNPDRSGSPFKFGERRKDDSYNSQYLLEEEFEELLENVILTRLIV